jgi:hypothetical protein
MASGTLCGGPLIRMALCWICGSQSRRNTDAAKKYGAPPTPGLEHSCGALTPTQAVTSASHEAVHIPWSCARLPFGLWTDPGSLSPAMTSFQSLGVSRPHAGAMPGVERGDWDENRRRAPQHPPAIFRLSSSPHLGSEKLFISFHTLTLPFFRLCAGFDEWILTRS